MQDEERDSSNPLLRDDTRVLRTKCLGFVQLFDRPHPSRHSESSTDSLERTWGFDGNILSEAYVPSSISSDCLGLSRQETPRFQIEEKRERKQQQQQTSFDLAKHTKRFQDARHRLISVRKRLKMVSDDISKSRSETTHQDQEDVALSDNIPESIRAAAASLVAASVALISSKHAFYIAKQCEMIPKLVKRARVLQDRLDNLKREANEAQQLLESNNEMKASSSTKYQKTHPHRHFKCRKISSRRDVSDSNFSRDDVQCYIKRIRCVISLLISLKPSHFFSIRLNMRFAML